MQKFVKKGESSRSRDGHREKSEKHLRDEDNSYNHSQSIIREIKMIARGPSTGGSFKSPRKSQQGFVNSVHGIPPLK